MGDKASEQLSALMDDELDSAELQLLLRRIRDNGAYGEQWQRFHLVSEAMRNGLPDRVDVNLAERVRAAVDADPTRVGPPAEGEFRRLRVRPVVGLAVAASLTAVVAVGVKMAGDGPGEAFPTSTELVLPRAAVDDDIVSPSVASQFLPANSQMEAKMYPYLLNHNEQVSRNVAPKVLPLGRMVGYEISR